MPRKSQPSAWVVLKHPGVPDVSLLDISIGAASSAFAAIDLGATSGRVILGVIHNDSVASGERIELIETGRFANGPVSVPVHEGVDLRWDILHLWRGILDGLREAGRVAASHDAHLTAIGVDSWAVDYGLLDSRGTLVANPRSYRDPALVPIADKVYQRISPQDHYQVNGLQHLPFTTEFQLVRHASSETFAAAQTLLLLPDLINYWLTGARVAEVTNASTTGLLDARSREWSPVLLERLAEEYPALTVLPRLLPSIVEPGSVVGTLRPEVQKVTGLGPLQVVAVASHDTASAIVGTPLGAQMATYLSASPATMDLDNGFDADGLLPQASRPAGDPIGSSRPVDSSRPATGGDPVTVANPVTVTAPPADADLDATAGPAEPGGPVMAAYISSGTWSLVGFELDAPVLTEASREAGFTNELGLDRTVRYLHNVMGLWVLDECRRQWARSGTPVVLADLLAAAAQEPGNRTIIDLDAAEFLTPGDMPRRVREAAARAGQHLPGTRPAIARAVLDSLAHAYAQTISRGAELAGVTVNQIHIVGGGSQNALLCQLTANATGLPVIAGPVEAAALGNVLVQARAVGAITPNDSATPGDSDPHHGTSLATLRDVVIGSTFLTRYEPA